MSTPQADQAVGAAGTRPVASLSRDRSAARGSLPGWLVAGVPALAELIVGGYRISGPSLWRDEAATISGSQRPVGAIFALVRNQDVVHGPYYLLMHAVIAVGGISATVLRLPSLIAMCLAAALTAILGRRLAIAAKLPWPAVTGLAAGLLLVSVPLTTRYAQEARPYALTTLFAVLATYLLVRAAGSGRWTWWTGYAVALTLTGMFNLFAVLLAVAHGLSLVAARQVRSAPADRAVLEPTRPGSAASGSAVLGSAALEPATLGMAAPGSAEPGSAGWVADGAVVRWLAACAGAAVLLAPMVIVSLGQSAQLDWVTTPGPSAVAALVRDFAGWTVLIPVVAVLAGLGCAAGAGLRRGNGLTLAVVALPWLALPPVVLLAVSLVHPVYVERYVVFCLPALSVLSAAGLTRLAQLTSMELRRRGVRAGHARSAKLLAVAPSVVIAVIMVVDLIGPQQAIRQVSARPDNLRAVAAVVAARELPGDAIVYLPWDTRMIGLAYPAPFLRLRDIELGVSPIGSATLRGLEAPAGAVAARLGDVTRVWTVQWAQDLSPAGRTPTDVVAARAISKMRLVKRWRIESVILSLYTAR